MSDDGLDVGVAPEVRWRPGAALTTGVCRTCRSRIRVPVPGKPRFVMVMGQWLCGVVMGPGHTSGWSCGYGGWPERVRSITWTGGVAMGRTQEEAYANWLIEIDRNATYARK